MRSENKVIVITGASAGMGEAIVTRFVQEGAKVVAVARRRERLEALIASLQGAPGAVVACPGDMSDPATSEKMVDMAVQTFGRLDVFL